VALVVMPWIDVAICPLGVASLKAYLQARGVEVDVHYLNLRLAERAGLKPYTALSRNPELWSEWFFAYHLFGAGGTGELSEKFSDLTASPEFKRFIAQSGESKARWRALLLDDVPAFLEECLTVIPWEQYGLVGFSTSMHSHAATLKLAKEIKERCGRPIVLGGPNVEGEMGEETLKGCPWVDYVVDGEGERPLLSIVDHLERGTPLDEGVRARGSAPRPAGQKPSFLDIGELPAPDHDDFFKTLRACPSLQDLSVTVTFETSRGCWWGQKQHCTFCGIPDAALAYRSKPAEQAARLIWEMHTRYKTNRLYATDLIMSLDHVSGLLPRLARMRREEDSDLRLFYETKSNLTRAQLEAFGLAGVSEILAGIESLSTPTLRLMRKGVRAIQNIQTLKWGQGYGIKVVWNYLYGFPGEDLSEYVVAAEAVPALTHLQPPSAFGPVRPDRSSPYHDRFADFGLKAVRPDAIYSRLYPESRFDLDRIAYSFDFEPGAVADLSDPRVAALGEAVKSWTELWPRNFFASRRGAESVELFDSRPTREGGGLEYREHALTGLEAAAYRRCETVRTFGEVLAGCRVRFPACGAEEVRAVLDSMVRRRWLWKEDDFYLSLAVPLTALPASQRHSLDLLQAAGRRGGLPGFNVRQPLA
jgi:ribosomal peptide maturation radical SAM protein 1